MSGDGVAYPKETLPRPMDVVWCRFPIDEKRGLPATDPHPGLVFATYEYKPGLFSVTVAFGTSNMNRGVKNENFTISNSTELDFAGLFYPTFFDLGRVKTLCWTSRWFESPDSAKYSTPKIGHIRDTARLIRNLERREAKGLSVPVKRTTPSKAAPKSSLKVT